MTHDEIRRAFSGPIASVRTPFTRRGDIDFPGLRRIVDFDVLSF